VAIISTWKVQGKTYNW